MPRAGGVPRRTVSGSWSASEHDDPEATGRARPGVDREHAGAGVGDADVRRAGRQPVDVGPDLHAQRRVGRARTEVVGCPQRGLLLAAGDRGAVVPDGRVGAAGVAAADAQGAVEVLARAAAVDREAVVLVVPAVDVERDGGGGGAGRALGGRGRLALGRRVLRVRRDVDRHALGRGAVGPLEADREGVVGRRAVVGAVAPARDLRVGVVGEAAERAVRGAAGRLDGPGAAAVELVAAFHAGAVPGLRRVALGRGRGSGTRRERAMKMVRAKPRAMANFRVGMS